MAAAAAAAAVAMVSEAKSKLLADYYDKRSRLGLVPNLDELEQFCHKNKLLCSRAELRSLRGQFKHTALFSQYKKPPHFFTASVLKFGSIMIDAGFYRPDLKWKNRGCAAFLAAVECVSGQASIFPIKDKTSKSWRAGITQFLERDFSSVSCFISDRDAAVTGVNFRESLREDHGIGWSFLKSRGSAIKAERLIR